MALTDILRSPRVLLCLVALGLLWPAAQAGAQETKTEQSAEATVCNLTKPDAIKAHGEPLGNSIWGRLCQVVDGKATYASGVTITVKQGETTIGTDTTEASGIFVVPIPANGVYQVILDEKTLPKGFALTNKDGAVLSQVKVNLGDLQVVYRMGADTRGERTFEDYATSFAKGVRYGLILAVAAIGLSLVFGVTGLVNFAHAELVTLGAVVAFSLNNSGLPLVLAIVLAMVVGAGASAASDVGIWRPLRKRRMALLSMMVVTIGLSIAVRNIIQVIFGVRGRRFQASVTSKEQTYLWFRLTPNDLLIMATCVVVLVAVTLLLRKTRLGTAIRAVADNPDLAASSGIAVDGIVTWVWAICGGLAALGGILYGLTETVRFDMGFLLLLSLFAAVVLGGLGNAYGAILGALIIGIVQEMSVLWVDAEFKFVVAMAVLILVLLVRPQGVLGKRERFG